MSRIQIQGRPKVSHTKTGKTVVEVNQNVAPRRKDRQSGQWEQRGDDLWVRGALWGDEAERINALCPQGWRIILDGDLQALSYRDKDGQPRTNLELLFPRFVGLVPPRDAPTRPTLQGTFTPPADDPRGTPATEEAPF